MNIRINGRRIDKWCNLSVELLLDSVKSLFSFDLYWEPNDPDTFWRKLLLPGAYNICTIVSDNGALILTGVMHSPSFKSGSQKYLVNISGCSLTGVLDDIEYAAVVANPQSSGTTLKQIACTCANPLGIYVKSNTEKSDQQVSLTNPDMQQKCTDYLAAIGRDLGVILSHDENGNLVLTTITETKPIYHFADGMPGVEIELMFCGEKMHSTLIGKTNADTTNSDPQNAYADNPYVAPGGAFSYRNAAINNSNILNAPEAQLQLLPEFNATNRPCVYVQSSTDIPNLQDFIDQKLAEELKEGIQMSIKMQGWELNGKIPRPGMIISVISPENYLFQPTNFIIDSIDFQGDEKTSIATLNCVVPEVYNDNKPKNIFIANNQNTIFEPFFIEPFTKPLKGIGFPKEHIDL